MGAPGGAELRGVIVLLNKPYGVMCAFTDKQGRPTLKDYVPLPNIYACGRLDFDSEGLLVLTDDGRLQARLSDPRFEKEKVYWAQVEREPSEEALQALREGVVLNDGPTRPAGARVIPEPEGLWPRDPPIRFRLSVPTVWLELRLREGRNRQVRRMTAAVGHPTLRLIRAAVGPYALEGLGPGRWRKG